MSRQKTEPLLGELQLIHTVKGLREWREQALFAGGKPGVKLGLVPTMGALHAGHMSLVEHARKECDKVIVSIFVNPLQFGPSEDFARYPRTLEKDVAMCKEADVDCVFNPSVEEFYGDSKEEQTMVIPPNALISRLCGKFRPGHFEGVATVVSKLFNSVQPHIAYFGEKDYQQMLVVKKMVADLNMPIVVQGVPIVREPDGLALSSRNVYLSAEERTKAPLIYKVMNEVKTAAQANPANLQSSLEKGVKELSQSGFIVQYLEACQANNLEHLEVGTTPMVILCAAKLGNVRLIDNLIVR